MGRCALPGAGRLDLVRDLLSAGNAWPALEHAGLEAVRVALVGAAARFRRRDGSYLCRNTFRYLVSSTPPTP